MHFLAWLLQRAALLTSCVFFTISPADAVEDVTCVEGWDWSLPKSCKPVEYSGFVTWGAKRYDPRITVSGIFISWKELNPAQDVYNWRPLIDRIDANTKVGMRSGLHLHGVELPSIPDWVLKKYNPYIVNVPLIQDTQPWRLQNVAPWTPGVQQAFEEFLKTFAQTGIAQRKEVVYGYLHVISPSRGEEFALRPIDIELYEKNSGLTPEILKNWLQRRVDAMLSVFKGVEYKLAWMGSHPISLENSAYAKATADMWKYAIERGAGIRSGGIDFQTSLHKSEPWGSRIDKDGYCVVDDAQPTIAEGRFRGDENEEYGKRWEWRFGPVQSHTYRHRVSSLRALQMRQNFEMVSQDTLALNPELNDYVLLELGHHAGDAPDAWAYLRQSASGKGDGVKNVERWLLQREVEGSRTLPALKTKRPTPSKPEVILQEYDARQTDHAHGQDGFSFRMDPLFWPKPAPAQLKVTFMDTGLGQWWIESTNAKGEKVKSAKLKNSGSGEIKTATFKVEELAAGQKFPGQIDFRIVSEEDLTVSFVRVIRASATEL